MEYVSRLPALNCDSTLYLPGGLTVESVEAHVRASSGKEVPHSFITAAQSSPNGASLFVGGGLALIIPPLPLQTVVAFRGCETGPLAKMLEEDKTIAIVLVRLGAYAVGVCHGEQLVESKVGTGLVHSRHRQGGSSSQRFRRRREKQIEQFLIRVCERVNERIGQHASQIDFISYGGARTTIDLLKKRCAVLSSLQITELPPLLDITDPRQAVLQAAITRVWSSHVFEWREGDAGAD